MRVLLIDVNAKGSSTGKIVYSLYTLIRQRGGEAAICYGRGKALHEENIFKFGLDWETWLHALFTRLTGFTGCFSFFSTIRLLRFIKSFNPDVVHIHELHGYFVNIKPVISYLKKHGIKTICTLHCEFMYTGKCGYSGECENWKSRCGKCPRLKEYPASLVFDQTEQMFIQKKRLLEDFNELLYITPSAWLAERAKKSFLGKNRIEVINNGIALDVFRPRVSDFREKYHIGEDKFVLLGVASVWERRKGLDVFVELSRRLDDRFIIVVVGTNDAIDRQLPENIISIHRTENQQGLAELYSAADLFVNPTREENYPTVNMEAVACGTPVITFRTGGSPEIIDESCGSVVECDDVGALEQEILRIYSDRPYTKEACLKKAKSYDENMCFEKYLGLYGL